MIKSVEFKNWRSHLNTKMEFSEGTNVLVGIVGAGKTSVLDGICFGLFGTFPMLASKKVRLEDVIMKKPHKKDKAEVIVNFCIGNDDFSVRRVIEKGKTTAELRKNGKLVEAPQTQRVTEEIERLLKINYDLFTRAVYSEQNQIDMFLTIPKGQRMKKIDELLSIDKFEIVRKNAVSLINKCFSHSNEKKKIIEELEAGMIGNVESLKDELDKIRKERKKLEDKLRTIKDEKTLQEKKLAELKKIDKRMREINQEEKTCIALIQAYKADIDKLSGLIDVAEKSDEEILRDIKKMEEEISVLGKKVMNYKKRLLDLRKSISSKETEMKILEKKVPEIKKKLEDKKSLERKLKRSGPDKINEKIKNRLLLLDKEKGKLHRLESKIDEIEETLRKMEDIENRCPLCDQPMSKQKKQKIMKSKQARINRALKSKEICLKNIEKFEKEIANLRVRLKEAERMETQVLGMRGLEKELNSAIVTLKSLKQDISALVNEEKMLDKNTSLLERDLEKNREEVNKLKRTYEKKKELVEKTKKIEEAQARIGILRKERQRFSGFYPEIIQSIENDLMEVHGMMKGLEAKIQGMISAEKDKMKLLEEAEKTKKTIEGYKKEVERIDAVAEQLSLFESALKLTQDQLRKNFISAVNRTMSEIWNQIYPYDDFYSCRLAVDNDYTLQLLDDTGWVNVDGIASGGERSIACLVLRIAFSLVLAPQLRWLVMDEPTHNLDSRTVEDFSKLLREKLPNMIDQVFVITHDPSLESAVSGYLYKLHRDKGKNEPTQVQQINVGDEIR